MDPRLIFSMIQLLMQCMEMRNKVILLLISEMEAMQRDNVTRRRRDSLREQQAIMQSHLLQLELVGNLFIAVTAGSITDRSVYSWHRPQGAIFWEQSVLNFTDEQWREHFRMSRQTFDYLASELRPVLEKEVTNFKEPIGHERRLAAVLWWFATPGDYRTIATLFGIGTSTLCVLVREVCSAVKNILFHRYISMPSGERLTRTIEGFERRGFPQCAGAIDGTHLPVIAPCDSPADYHNRKGWYSIIMQAIVDHNYCFTDIYIGWPGRTHDARVLAHSDVFERAEHQQNGLLFPPEYNRNINGVDVPVCIIGDPAYPLKKWLMKGYINNQRLTREQNNFNFRLSSARMVVEDAFGRLKGRWRRLLKRNDVDTSFASEVVAVACVLHNLCEIHREVYNPHWDLERAAEEAAGGLNQPGPAPRQNAGPAGGNASATDIRNAIMGSL